MWLHWDSFFFSFLLSKLALLLYGFSAIFTQCVVHEQYLGNEQLCWHVKDIYVMPYHLPLTQADNHRFFFALDSLSFSSYLHWYHRMFLHLVLFRVIHMYSILSARCSKYRIRFFHGIVTILTVSTIVKRKMSTVSINCNHFDMNLLSFSVANIMIVNIVCTMLFNFVWIDLMRTVNSRKTNNNHPFLKTDLTQQRLKRICSFVYFVCLVFLFFAR